MLFNESKIEQIIDVFGIVPLFIHLELVYDNIAKLNQKYVRTFLLYFCNFLKKTEYDCTRHEANPILELAIRNICAIHVKLHSLDLIDICFEIVTWLSNFNYL